MMSRTDLVFGINGSVIDIPQSQVDPTVKLAGYLREVACLKGTKVGCGEGGCGSCAVIVSRFDAALGKVVTTSTNSCLKPLVALHGCHITTVEGIGGPNHKDGFHKLQKRFAELNASQCGFCTPGFVVSMYSQFAKKPDSTMADIENSMDGNLCRCTGYRPIMDAGKSFAKDSNVHNNLVLLPDPKEKKENNCHHVAGDNDDEAADVNPDPTVIPNDQLAVQAEIEAMFPDRLKDRAAGTTVNQQPLGVEYTGSNVSYFRAGSVNDVKTYLRQHPEGKIACAQTSAGVYKTNSIADAKSICDVGAIPEMRKNDIMLSGVCAGGATPISSFIGTLLKAADQEGGTTAQCFNAVVKVVQQIANVHVRDSGSIAGNLSMTKELGFASDLATPLCAVGATVNVLEIETSSPPPSSTDDEDEGGSSPLLIPYLLYDFLQQPTPAGRKSLIVSVTVPFPQQPGTVTGCFRTAIRSTNAHAITNGSFHAAISDKGLIESMTAIYGCVGEFDVPGKNAPKRNVELSRLVTGRTLGKGIVRELCADFQTKDFVLGNYKAAHRRKLVKAFLIHFLEDVKQQLRLRAGGGERSKEEGQLLVAVDQPLHTANQKFVESDSPSAVGQPIPRQDGVHHAAGSAVYASDIPEAKNALHAAWVTSTVAKGTIKDLHREVALRMPGVHSFIGATELPGWATNKVVRILTYYNIQGDYPGTDVFCENDVEWYGARMGLVLADTQAHAIQAANKMRDAAEYVSDDDPTITISDARRKGDTPVMSRSLVKGNMDTINGNPDLTTLNTSISLCGQKHFYMETHSVYAEFDDRKITTWIGMQFPVYVNECVALAHGMQMNEVEVKCYRMGGSFGSKIGPTHAIAASWAARISGRPVKLHCDRAADMVLHGGREDTEANFNVSIDAEGKIHGVEYEVAKSAGAVSDSAMWPIMIAMPRGMFNPYHILHHKGEFKNYNTNTVPRAAVRAPGEIEIAYCQESIIDRIADHMNVHSQEIREKNFMEKGDVLTVEGFTIADQEYTFTEMYGVLMDNKGWRKRVEESIAYNHSHHLHKRGVAIVPFVYHLAAFPASAQIAIYRDGSVIVHHCGVEMGNGLITKVLQAANQELSKLLPAGQNLEMNLFRSAGNQTSVLPQMGITGGSTTSESNVAAVTAAAAILIERLTPVVESLSEEKRGDWKTVVETAVNTEVNLCAQTNTTSAGGANIPYCSLCWGAAEIELDVLTGEVTTTRVDIQYDCGKSLNPAIDIGQIEGAFMMGLGCVLLEDNQIDPTTGQELGNGTWEYKVPFARDLPRVFNVELQHNGKFDRGVMSSKASGEPPLCLASAVSSAVHQAIRSARRDGGLGGFKPLALPMTPDKIALACGSSIELD